MAGATPEIWEWTFLTPELRLQRSRLKSQAISLGNSTGNQPESQEPQVEILLHCTEEDNQAAIPTDPYSPDSQRGSHIWLYLEQGLERQLDA